MARGIFAGIATGLVVAGLGLGVASLFVGPVEMDTASETAAPEAPVVAPPAVPEPEETPAPAQSPADDAPADDAPENDATPAADAGAAAPADDAAPVEDLDPQATAGDGTTVEDTDAGASADVTPADDTPPEGDPVIEEAAPVEDAGIPEATEATPAQPDALGPVEDGTAASEPSPAAPVEFAPQDDPAAPEVTTAPEVVEPEPEIPSAQVPANDTPPVPDAPETEEPVAVVEEPPSAAPAPQDAEAEPESAAAPALVADETPADTPVANVASAPEPEPVEDAPAETAPAVVTGRLPSIGAETAPDEVALAPQPETAEDAPAVVTGRLPSIGAEAAPEEVALVPQPALVRNAVDFEPVGDQPLLSILLLDTGADRSEITDLGKLPFPVTVAVDAGALDAAEAVAFYRGQGAEVVVTVPLPEGATPTDVDVSFEAYAPLLEPAVAVLLEEALGFQALGEGAVQVGVNLAETGHGLVSFPSGLNTGHKAALKEGAKAGLVFRDLDSEGQEGPVIRRFLDNAAFRARNENGVIVVARTRPETIQALLEWSLGTRAESVTLAPVSAVLSTQ